MGATLLNTWLLLGIKLKVHLHRFSAIIGGVWPNLLTKT
jgi:hypothetical protein